MNINTNKIDCNCLVGRWPFRMLREAGIDAIRAKHAETGISYGLAANMNSIFYNDPLEGEAEMAAMLKGTGYGHVMTVNPMLPCFDEDIEICIEKYKINAVRIYPGYHQYRLDKNERVDRLCRLLQGKGLPLFISVRLEDERINYLFKPFTPDEFGLYEFLKQEPECKVLLLTVRLGELLSHRDIIKPDGRIWYDTSGLKDKPFGIEELCGAMGSERLVYGSQYPLFSLRSTLYLIERNQLEEGLVSNILWNNAQSLLERSNAL